MSEVKTGIVGLGVMGQMYANALVRNKSAHVAAVADHNKERLEFAHRTYECRVYDNYSEMLDKGGLDAVIITLPDFMHRDPVIEAAEHGLHILVEKPFATSVEDARAMVDAVTKTGVKCMVEFFNRWSPPFASAKKAVENRELGDIVSVSAELNDSIYVPTGMLTWSAHTTPAWFLMSHTADLVSWITGKKPVAVHARGVKKILMQQGIDTYDLIEALAEYPDGTLGRFSNCWVLPAGMPILYELRMRIVGSKAAVDIDTSDQDIHVITREKYIHPVTEFADILGRYVGHPYTMLEAFMDNIIEDTEPLIGPLDGLENTIFLEAVHRSVESGGKISIQW